MAGMAHFTTAADVRCSDGACSEVRRVAVDPVARAVTHLVADPGRPCRLGRLTWPAPRQARSGSAAPWQRPQLDGQPKAISRRTPTAEVHEGSVRRGRCEENLNAADPMSSVPGTLDPPSPSGRVISVGFSASGLDTPSWLMTGPAVAFPGVGAAGLQGFPCRNLAESSNRLPVHALSRPCRGRLKPLAKVGGHATRRSLAAPAGCWRPGAQGYAYG
jgi:hypothetical protein